MKYVYCEKNWEGENGPPPHLMLRALGGGGVHTYIYIYSVHRTERYTNMLIVKILYVYFDNSTKYKST